MEINAEVMDILLAFVFTTSAIRKYENDVEERVSPNGKKYIWIGGTVKQLEQEENSDVLAVEDGYISITPVNIDMTNKNKIKDLENLI